MSARALLPARHSPSRYRRLVRFQRYGAATEVPVDENYWTASEAAKIMTPHLSVTRVRQIIRAAGVEPQGRRHGRSTLGRQSTVYRAEDLIRLLGYLEPPGNAR